MLTIINSKHSLQYIASSKWGAKDANVMLNNCRIAQKLIRAPLAAFALYCIALALAPQAAAQACGPSLMLTANQWTLVGIPCVPPINKQTVGDVFGPSLGAENYGVTWIAWKRIYDDNRCVVSSGPADCYLKLTLTSAAATGDAFWIYTTQQTTLQFSSTTGSTPGLYFEFSGAPLETLSTDGNGRYYMFANPYSDTVRWADIIFRARFLYWTVNRSTQNAINDSIVSKNVHYWNGNTYYTRDLTSPEATFKAKEAAWLELLQPRAWITAPVILRVPQP